MVRVEGQAVTRNKHVAEPLRSLINSFSVGIAEDEGYPPPCPGRRDHSWVVADEDNGGDGRCYCEYCGADGDA